MIKGSRGHYSRPVIRISILAIALSLTIMFVSIAILTGFQQEIRDKVIGFTGHIQITRFSGNTNLVPFAVDRQQAFLPALRAHPKIKHVQVYASKAGIIRTSDQIQGAVLKGVGADYDWDFFRKRMSQGIIPDYSDTAQKNNVIISKAMAELLGLFRRPWLSSGGKPHPPEPSKRLSGNQRASGRDGRRYKVVVAPLPPVPPDFAIPR